MVPSSLALAATPVAATPVTSSLDPSGFDPGGFDPSGFDPSGFEKNSSTVVQWYWQSSGLANQHARRGGLREALGASGSRIY